VGMVFSSFCATRLHNDPERSKHSPNRSSGGVELHLQQVIEGDAEYGGPVESSKVFVGLKRLSHTAILIGYRARELWLRTV